MSRVEILCADDTELVLDAALLLYLAQNTGDVYVTQHGARIVDGRPVLLPGVPLTLDGLADFADLAAQRTSFRGFIHERAVYLGPNTLAWWAPASKRRIWFKCDGKIGERSGECNHPPLLFIVKKKHWSVFALRANERPAANTKLYVAPYLNVWKSGEICVGNVELPDAIGGDAIDPYENAFFRSRFTHTNHDRLIHRRGGAVQLWLDLLGGAEFPLNCLIDAKLTLATAIGKTSNED
ncbi:PRTRC system protein B [Trinickia dinghuensis]|uniref:PRTRC system protein B n=1 Tax=Trinickia dinghuensis TaxID=2291023 RepID=A0A3D8K3K9_9BURK|nr:PRTRC system protein B [Trinickia dinghuensis]RDU99181.1 PRTRC system protein B [Trinickia dinghuensis]